jgi:N-acetylmuramoyl-L-alanine amidase
MNAFGGQGYGEIRSPFQHGGMTPVLAETNFHDNPETAQWILGNKDEIASAYVRALVNTLNIPKKPN